MSGNCNASAQKLLPVWVNSPAVQCAQSWRAERGNPPGAPASVGWRTSPRDTAEIEISNGAGCGNGCQINLIRTYVPSLAYPSSASSPRAIFSRWRSSSLSDCWAAGRVFSRTSVCAASITPSASASIDAISAQPSAPQAAYPARCRAAPDIAQ